MFLRLWKIAIGVFFVVVVGCCFSKIFKTSDDDNLYQAYAITYLQSHGSIWNKWRKFSFSVWTLVSWEFALLVACRDWSSTCKPTRTVPSTHAPCLPPSHSRLFPPWTSSWDNAMLTKVGTHSLYHEHYCGTSSPSWKSSWDTATLMKVGTHHFYHERYHGTSSPPWTSSRDTATLTKEGTHHLSWPLFWDIFTQNIIMGHCNADEGRYTSSIMNIIIGHHLHHEHHHGTLQRWRRKVHIIYYGHYHGTSSPPWTSSWDSATSMKIGTHHLSWTLSWDIISTMNIIMGHCNADEGGYTSSIMSIIMGHHLQHEHHHGTLQCSQR